MTAGLLGSFFLYVFEANSIVREGRAEHSLNKTSLNLSPEKSALLWGGLVGVALDTKVTCRLKLARQFTKSKDFPSGCGADCNFFKKLR